MTQPSHETLLIIDFGSQVTQLIARRLRELNVYCEIHPYQAVTPDLIARLAPKAVILSGGPASVPEPGSPRAPEQIFSLGVPVFGICYGQQTMMEQLGGKVEAAITANSAAPLSNPCPAMRRTASSPACSSAGARKSG